MDDASIENQQCEKWKISGWFAFLSIFCVTCGILGALENFVLICGLIRCKFFPVNVRFLLGNMTLGILFVAVFSAWDYSRKIGALFSGHLTEVSMLFCTLNSVQIVVTTAVIIVSLASLGIERWYSTSHMIPQLALSKPPLLTKENHTKMVRFLVAGIWTFGILTWVVFFAPSPTGHHGEEENNRYNITHCSCGSRQHSSGNKEEGKRVVRTLAFLGVVLIYMAIEIGSIVLYFRVWDVNKTRLADFSINTARHSLQERFQIRQNIQITQMMLPAVTLHAICWFAIQIAAIGKSVLLTTEDLVTSESASMVNMIPLHIYQVLHPVMILWRSEQLRKAVRGMVFCKRQVYPTPADATLTYGENKPNEAAEVDRGLPIAPGTSQVAGKSPGRGSRLPHLSTAATASRSDRISSTMEFAFKVNPDTNAKILEQIWNTGKGAVL